MCFFLHFIQPCILLGNHKNNYCSASQPPIFSYTLGGEDYRVVSYTVVLIPRHNNTGFVTIHVLNDALLEGNEEFIVHLAIMPGSGASLDSTNTMVIIEDNESKCYCQW